MQSSTSQVCVAQCRYGRGGRGVAQPGVEQRWSGQQGWSAGFGAGQSGDAQPSVFVYRVRRALEKEEKREGECLWLTGVAERKLGRVALLDDPAAVATDGAEVGAGDVCVARHSMVSQVGNSTKTEGRTKIQNSRSKHQGMSRTRSPPQVKPWARRALMRGLGQARLPATWRQKQLEQNLVRRWWPLNLSRPLKLLLQLWHLTHPAAAAFLLHGERPNMGDPLCCLLMLSFLRPPVAGYLSYLLFFCSLALLRWGGSSLPILSLFIT